MGQSLSSEANSHSASLEIPTVFTRFRHWFLSWARCIQFTTSSYPTSL